ncbi:MAG: hypothetical protein NUV58_01595 [Candidatus Roizmanbacteria bacterium]|nr:hypothetical protein [Candidatus Roizmanbacteria bacterium]
MARTKEEIEKIASDLLKNRDPANDISIFLQDIETYLHALKFEANDSIGHYGLNNKEIPEFLRDVFPEIKDINGFLTILSIFGFNRGLFNKDFFTDAYVFFDIKKSGFIIAQQPLGQLNTLENSEFSLMYQRNKKGNPVLTLSGVNDGLLLGAKYEHSPSEKQYVLVNLDISVESEKHLSSTQRGIFTKKMLKKANIKKHMPGLQSLQEFKKIPQQIPTS